MIKKILYYISVFCGMVLFLFFLQYISILIPNNVIEDNMNESVMYLENENNYVPLFEVSQDYLKNSLLIDNYGDSLILDIIWNSNENFGSLVKLPYYKEDNKRLSNSLYKSVVQDKKANKSYFQYWVGIISYVKPLMVFFNIKEIKIINTIIIVGLMGYLVYLIYRKNKILALSFMIGVISIMPITIFNCLEYFPIYVITFISSIVTIKTLDKGDKFFYTNMVITGVVTCFFDLLTGEVITLMIPLILKLVLGRKKDKKIKYIIKCSLIWLFSFLAMFFIKWILAVLIYGVGDFLEIWNRAKIRIYDMPRDSIMDLGIILYIPSLLFPFNIFECAPVLFIIYGLIYLYTLFVSDVKVNYLILLISMIGIIRLIVLHAHTYQHYFFDYRVLFPFMMISSYTMIRTFKH